ncbi:MAG: hypothetical protein OXU61_10575 [Gammaproteobacteria bacterium]|nr:hypothetical protein [Gammaproteobacteria bacterium]
MASVLRAPSSIVLFFPRFPLGREGFLLRPRIISYKSESDRDGARRRRPVTVREGVGGAPAAGRRRRGSPAGVREAGSRRAARSWRRGGKRGTVNSSLQGMVRHAADGAAMERASGVGEARR